MRKGLAVRLPMLFGALGASLLFVHPAFAAAADVDRIKNFMLNIIQIITGLASIIAAGVIVFGGILYITSSGKPERLEGAKNTIKYAALGLVITAGAFLITSIVNDAATSAFGK